MRDADIINSGMHGFIDKDGKHMTRPLVSGGGIQAFWGVAVSDQLTYGIVNVRRASGLPYALQIIDPGSATIEVFVGVDSFVRGQSEGLQGDPVYCIQNLDPNVQCDWVGITFFCGGNWEYPSLANLSPLQDVPIKRGS